MKVATRLAVSLTLSLYLLLFLSGHAFADDIYTWTDENGQVHFSTEPRGDAAKAELPEVRRENLDEKIEEIKGSTPPNCHNHGGVDCSRGRDSDGSVICLDGFANSMLPYRFSCLEARLRASELSLLDSKREVIGIINKDFKISQEQVLEAGEMMLLITLRNNSSVEAFGVSVHVQTPNGKKAEAAGPEKVESFGVAEYLLPLKQLPQRLPFERLARLDFKVRCTNCGAVLRTGP
ncbi:MAG: DUF4124 domain-containing protein [Bdellovibrionales bacterium]|nr:DUF4124 domain-containing protein [Bdellovibrionales bacterium]